MNPLTRAQIVAEARGWLGTPWVHQGRSKGVGVDCAGLLTQTAASLQQTAFDIADYERMPDGVALMRLLDAHMVRILLAKMQPGDVIALRFDGHPTHIAILSDYVWGGLSMVHASTTFEKVCEHRLDSKWRARIVGAWTWPALAEAGP